MCLGIPGEVLEITGGEGLERTARVRFGGVARLVCLAGVPDASPGDFVTVHAGFAISRIDREEAARLQGFLSEIASHASLEIPQERPGGERA
ncbi:HypC/HybG/HupF family hydrogenase formation chaperone [Candidatus Fermentibacteria bacterium]|nr:HypC/HybG/HupF family hydrogenase formation chaperone [Candidatus Fermentibacteria bacterium]